ncbi:hypothetical protein CY35_03G047700 [Sphagnum magellanicum]|nr:hypothetical protein CY35_03G047700 [Sphagnum magellanicum]
MRLMPFARLEVLQGMEQECMTALSISCLQRLMVLKPSTTFCSLE